MNGLPVWPIGLLISTILAVGLMATVDIAYWMAFAIVAAISGLGAMVDWSKGRFR